LASRIEYSDRAKRNLDLIKQYITQDNPRAAFRTVERIARSISRLAEFPELGPIWRESDSRALVIPGLPYRAHYQVVGEVVEILTIVHTSRRFPSLDQH
jgi:addiction module RelE/StbE family toxin